MGETQISEETHGVGSALWRINLESFLIFAISKPYQYGLKKVEVDL
jgi:hypothetical protein